MNEAIVTQFLNHLGYGTILDSITGFVSWGIFLFALFIILAFIILMYDKKRGKIIIVALLIALVLHFAITEAGFKGMFAQYVHFRERPFEAYPNDIFLVGNPPLDASFPSGHMSLTLAVLTVLVYFYRKQWPWALGFILLMAFARLHNGVHYPSDVLVGSVLGFAYGVVAIWAVKKIFAEKKRRKK